MGAPPRADAAAVIARQAEMLGNRVKKTWKHLAARMEKRGVGAWRLFDRDIPELRLVIDWYEGHLVVGEYARTQTDELPGWLEKMAAAAAGAVGVPAEKIHLRQRRTRPGGTGGAGAQRYDRLAQTGKRIEVREGGLKFLCNLDDYLDTGLFLDHRETRARVRAEAGGRRVANLFGYTGSFTVYAAAGGATSTVTVDASNVYLDWAKDNLALNGLAGAAHTMVRADVDDWITRPQQKGRFGLVVLDPPSFSDRGGGLDVQRDHRWLVEGAVALLEPGGILYFSTNHQRFTPELEGLEGVKELKDITAETIPEDFRNKSVHRAWRMVRA